MRFVLSLIALSLALISPAAKAADEAPPAPATVAVDRQGPQSGESLSADEVTQLSARAEEPGPEVAGGALTNQQLTYIVIALATAVLVLILK